VHTRNSILDMERKIASVKIRTDTLDLEVWNRRTKKRLFSFTFFFSGCQERFGGFEAGELAIVGGKTRSINSCSLHSVRVAFFH
jgi:hypothetical protein